MSTTKTDETTTPTLQPTRTADPDGKSRLPLTLPDFPPPVDGDSGDSGSTAPK
jgi:hypothetical protein